MSSSTRPPVVPLVLGIAGLVPFIACALAWRGGFALPLIGGGQGARMALVVYAIAILSFLGGVRWGIALAMEEGKGDRDYILSVVPVLMAWSALYVSAPADLWVLFAAMVAWGLMDYGMACRTIARRSGTAACGSLSRALPRWRWACRGGLVRQQHRGVDREDPPVADHVRGDPVAEQRREGAVAQVQSARIGGPSPA